MIDVIETKNIYKQYNISVAQTIWNRLYRLPARLTGNNTEARLKSKSGFWALNDVSFNVKKGEVLGIIGPNGAGKSTLLKLLCKVTEPSSGKINVNGSVAPLIEIGAGFHPELTGRENIFLNATIMGLKRKEIHRRLDKIIEFSGLTNFIDTPVKKYSSGMMVRLGFSVAVHIEPDILLVDEVLSVGDIEFQRRSLNMIKNIIHEGTSVVFVSHNLWAVQNICDRVIELDRGKIVDQGTPTDVIISYENKMYKQNKESRIDQPNKYYDQNIIRRGSGEVDVINLTLSDTDGKRCSRYKIDSDLHITFDLKSKIHLKLPTIQLRIFREDGIPCTLSFLSEKIDHLRPGDTKHIHLIMSPVQLTPGGYNLMITIHDDKPMLAYAHSEPVNFKIADSNRFFKTNDPIQPVFEPVVRIVEINTH
jgi:lipopolysaccharide transport system ATP-binding protein